MTECKGFIDQVTHDTSLSFFAINNVICSGHQQDVTNALTQTAHLCRKLADKLRNTTDIEYHVSDFGDDCQLLQAINDVFEGERYGLGYNICDQIEHHLEVGRNKIYNQLREIATRNLMSSV